MPVCHSCPHNREIERLRKICGACLGSSDNFGGDVHIDAAENPATVMKRVDPIYTNRERTATQIDGMKPETAELLKRIVAEFAQLSDTEAPVVARKLRGQENWQIAHEMGLSKQVVWQRWNGLKKKNPIWAALDNGLIGKRGGGRKSDDPPEVDYRQGVLEL